MFNDVTIVKSVMIANLPIGALVWMKKTLVKNINVKRKKN